MTALPPDDDDGPMIPVGVHVEPLVTPARRMPAPREQQSLKRISYPNSDFLFHPPCHPNQLLIIGVCFQWECLIWILAVLAKAQGL